MKTIAVIVKIKIEQNADALETIEDCEYSFTGEGIIDTEIIEVIDEKDVSVFN